MKNINFIRQRQTKVNLTKQKDALVFRIAFGIFTVALIVALSILSFNFYLNISIKAIKNDQEGTKQLILKEEQTEAAYLIFANKLSIISELFKTRRDKQKAITFFNELLLPIGTIEATQYKDNQLSLSYITNDIFTLKNTYEVLEQPEIHQEYPKIRKNGLKREQEGSYQFRLNIDI